MTFQNKGDKKKKKSQELPGRKHVIHKGLESQLALNSDPAETMEPRTPHPKGKICTNNRSPVRADVFRQARTPGPLTQEKQSVYFTKTQE